MDYIPPGSVPGILQSRISEGIAIPFCTGYSRPRNWTLVSCIAGRFFPVWATREALGITYQRLRSNFVHLVNQLLLLLLLSHYSHVRLCDPIDGSPPGSPVPGILQARTLEWVAISFSSTWKWKVKVKSPSRVRLLATSWTSAYQAPLSMGFSRQEYWSRVPLPSPIN